MEVLWCWRCKMHLPMLDEAEFEQVERLLHNGIEATKAYRECQGVSLDQVPKERLFQPALDEYERLTGFRETNVNALFHHRISIYGPPCERCGKVLRTPVASKCFECGQPVKHQIQGLPLSGNTLDA